MKKLEAYQGLLEDDQPIRAQDLLSGVASRIPVFGGLLSDIIDPREASAADLDRDAAYAAQDRLRANIGVNVRTDKKAGLRFADLIVDGQKDYETRNSDSLRPYVGKRVAIVRTGEGPAKAIGEVTVGEPIVVEEDGFRKLESRHLVPSGSDFDIKSGSKKYLYPMQEPVRYGKEADVGRGIISRKVKW